ncbi:MAG: ATP-binding cassette domain-containing protein, partial [Chloroflexi bacterium]
MSPPPARCRWWAWRRPSRPGRPSRTGSWPSSKRSKPLFPADVNAVRIEASRLELGGRQIWSGLTLDLRQGEFLTVIGPNGAGKTSFLKALLGLLPASGSIEVLGSRPRRGDPRIGYVPQQKSI